MAEVAQSSAVSNVADLRVIMADALIGAGLAQIKVGPRKLKAFTLPGENIRFFSEHAYRRPWGFVYSGSIGIELPRLRHWLTQNGKELGIFHSSFADYVIANDLPLSSQLMVEVGEPFSAASWAQEIRSRLERIPASEASLIEMMRADPGDLGLLHNDWNKPAWDYYRRWLDRPDVELEVPDRDARGRLIAAGRSE